MRAELTHERPTIQLRHHDVGDQQIGRLDECALQGVFTIDRGLDAVPTLLEHGRDHAEDPGVVVSDEYVRCHR